MNTITERRQELIDWVIKNVRGPEDNPYDGQHWGLNQARLILDNDLEQANDYFETIVMDPRPKVWPDGTVEGADWDFLGTHLLRTLLDFSDSPRLTQKAKDHLRPIFTEWKQPRAKHFKDSDRASRYPVIFTENHDIMCLTIGYFGAVLAGRDVSVHESQIAQSLSWRFKRGWTEWHSPVYQIHFLNALLLLADHAPHTVIKQSANDLINVQLSERAALSVRGYLGGAYCRGYDAQITNDRNDGYLPVMWLAFGLPDKADGLSSNGVHFASSGFEPHPEVTSLAARPAQSKSICHLGTRDCSTQKELPRQTICYYNTPHISLGSMGIFGRAHQPRFFNVMFADEPSKSLRTYLREAGEANPWYPRHERGELVQHQNWLLAKGLLVEEGGLSTQDVGGFNLYQVGKGLCAHVALNAELHVFQVGDLDQFADTTAFLAALTPPTLEQDTVQARTSSGETLTIQLSDMSIKVNGKPRPDWSNQLHAGPWIFSDWDSGQVTIKNDASPGHVFSDEPLRSMLPPSAL